MDVAADAAWEDRDVGEFCCGERPGGQSQRCGPSAGDHFDGGVRGESVALPEEGGFAENGEIGVAGEGIGAEADVDAGGEHFAVSMWVGGLQCIVAKVFARSWTVRHVRAGRGKQFHFFGIAVIHMGEQDVKFVGGVLGTQQAA